MDNTKNILLDEKQIIYYPSTISNFGVHSKKNISPKNLYMLFTPLISNQEISFTNTIMYPVVTTETTTDTEKNASHFENEKDKKSIKKDSTRLKTESSKDEKYNLSYDKQISKILYENNENSKEEETVSEIDINVKDNQEQKNALEMNPFFVGDSSLEVKNFINQDDNSQIEEKKINKILNKRKNTNDTNENNLFFKTTKNVNKIKNKEVFKNQLIKRTKRTKTLILNKSKNEDIILIFYFNRYI